jgi:hypothetical protein
VKTLPYPGFPTDLQPQLMSLLTTCSGRSVLEETVFEGRMRHGKLYIGLIHRDTHSVFFSFCCICWSVVLVSFCIMLFSGGATEAWSPDESESKRCNHQWQSRWQVFETAQTVTIASFLSHACRSQEEGTLLLHKKLFNS